MSTNGRQRFNVLMDTLSNEFGAAKMSNWWSGLYLLMGTGNGMLFSGLIIEIFGTQTPGTTLVVAGFIQILGFFGLFVFHPIGRRLRQLQNTKLSDDTSKPRMLVRPDPVLSPAGPAEPNVLERYAGIMSEVFRGRDTSKPIIVYLAGPINGYDDSTAKDWREYAKKNLKTQTLDPMSRDYRGRETEPGVAAEIVEGDKDDIDASEILLVNATVPSVGTSMEVLYAHEQGKIVVSVYTPEKPPSPWLVYHSDVVVKSLDEGIQVINDYLAQEGA